ncbi:unnamed protein product [Arabidopsis halleri]
MAEPVLEDTSLTFSSEFDSIAIHPSPFDNFCNSSSEQVGNSISDLRFLIDDDVGDGDGQFTIEEDLYFPSENESFAIPVDAREMSGDFTPASGISGDCVNEDTVKNKNGVLISTSIYCDRESPRDSDCSGTTQSLSLSAHQESAKRIKEIQEDSSEESRNNKYRRLDQDAFASVVTGGGEEDDEKQNVRLVRNRESAHLSRQRKKHYVEELEDKVRNMHSTISELSSKMSYFMAENVTLRQQMGPRNGMCRPPMYPPLAPMAYPWMPYPAYMVKPQGSQVPLLPIPRLKPQQSVAKVKKIKKVASVSVLGLLFCLFLFCALAPIVNISYGEYKSNYVTDGVYDQSRGRVLFVDSSNKAHCGGGSDQGVRSNVSETENLGPPRNSSEPLVASLFVPRNEKLVKIDGNLIIHSVLASEKARDSETKNNEGKSGVATTTEGIISPAMPLPDSSRTMDMSKHLYSESRKALSSSSSHDTLKDQLKSTTCNGKMQQWFREGIAGPMFSSGMCTEVFQFDVSSTSGSIIPASPPTEQSKNTDTHKGKKNRRILHGGLSVSDFNLTEDHNSSSKENIRDTKPAPSMVVSVLVDPREGGDGDIDEMMGGTKSLSPVFIVLLVDDVKYVTYSCILPRPEFPHLVTT